MLEDGQPEVRDDFGILGIHDSLLSSMVIAGVVVDVVVFGCVAVAESCGHPR